jgi:hypothetical protein
VAASRDAVNEEVVAAVGAGIAPVSDPLEQRNAVIPATASPSRMHERERRGAARIEPGQVFVRAP